MDKRDESAAAAGGVCAGPAPVAALAPAGPRRGAKVARSCGYGLVAVAALILISVGLLAARLAHGPMTIDGLAPLIANALDQRFGRGYDFSLGRASLVKRGFSPTLGVDGLTLKDGSGHTILAAPRAEVSVDLLSLVAGKVAPKRLEVFDVELRLALLPDGSIAQPIAPDSSETVALTPPLAEQLVKEGASPAEVGAPASETTGASPARDGQKPRALLVKQMASAIRLVVDALTGPDSQIAAVDRVAISRGRVVVDDRTTHQVMRFDGVDLAFERGPGGTTFNLSVDGPNGRWSATGLASGAPGMQRKLMLSLENLSIDEILLATGARSVGADFDMPLSASFSVGLKPDGVLSEATAAFSLGSGYLRFDDPNDEPMMIDSIRGGAHWDGARRRIVVDPLRLSAGDTHGAVAGAIGLPVHEGDPWSIELSQAETIVAAPERPGQKPVLIDAVGIGGRLFLGDKRMVFDRIMVGGPQAGFSMSGEVDWTNGPRLRFGASLDPTPVSVVTRLWPSFIAAPVRSYLIDHAHQGIVERGTLQFDFSAADLDAMRNEIPPPDEALLLDFAVSGGGVEFLNGAPPLTGVDGVGHVTGRTSTFTTTSTGLINPGEGLTVTVAPGSSFHIADATKRPTPAAVAAKVSGSVDAISAFLAGDAVKPYANLPLDRSTLHGDANGRVEIDLNLGPAMGPADTAIKVDAVVTNFVAENLLGRESLESATLNLNVDPTGLKANGQGRMFGAPAAIEMNQPAGKPASAKIRIVMDDAARMKQGLGGVPGVSGSIAASIAAPLGGAQPLRAEVDLDLLHAGIEWPGASKPPGRPGKAKFTLIVDNGKTSLDQIALDAGPIQARGQMELAADQGVQSARFSQVKFSPGDDARVEALRAGDSLKIMVRGSTIDARPFLKSLLSSTADAGPSAGGAAAASADLPNAAAQPGAASLQPVREIDFDVKTPLLTGYNKQVMSGLELRMLKHGDQFRQLSFAGRFGRDTVSGNLTGGPNGPQLTVLSDDAGSLLLFTDLYRHMEGGRLLSTMQMGQGLSGVLTIDGFVLRDEPALRRLVAESVPSTDAAGKVKQIDAGALALNRLQVHFERSGTRLLLRDGVMNGDALGLTVEGWLDFPHDGVDMKGTFVPAYAFNNLFAHIPVFGAILGGSANEGLIGVNYRVEGKISAPTLSINPLSVIAPGIFRQIFGVGPHAPAAGAGQ